MLHIVEIIVAVVLLALPAYLVVRLYLIAPWEIRKRQWVEMNPQFRVIEAGSVPVETSIAFQYAADHLPSLGFTNRGYVARRSAHTGQDSYVALWVNRSAGDTAQVIGVRTPSHQGGMVATLFVTYRTTFSDGRYMVTTNTSAPTIFPIDPKCDSVVCSAIYDMELLYRFHRIRTSTGAGTRTPVLPTMDDMPAYMCNESRDTFDRIASLGYYSADLEAERYQMTIIGAYIMTLRMLWPLKGMRLTARARKADRALREAGFGGLESFRQQQKSMQLAPVNLGNLIPEKSA